MRRYNFFIVLFILLLTVGCQKILPQEITTTSTPVVSKEVVTSTPKITITPKPVAPEITIDPYIKQCRSYRDDDGSINRTDVETIHQKQENIQYIDEDLGFTLDFPVYWKDYFIIKKSEEYEEINFMFYGKSLEGQGYSKYGDHSDGLHLFTIISEEAWDSFDDSTQSMCDFKTILGTAKGITYYVYTSTDFTLGGLEMEVDNINYKESYYQANEEEIKRIIDDFEMGEKIYKDIDNVLESFKELR